MAVHVSLYIFLFLRCAPLSTYACIEKPIKTVNHICTPHNSVLRCPWLLHCLFGARLGGLDHLLGAWFLLNTWLLRRLWLVFGSARFLALLTRFLSTTLVFGTAMVLALLTRFLSTTLVLHVIISCDTLKKQFFPCFHVFHWKFEH